MANGPNIFQMLGDLIEVFYCETSDVDCTCVEVVAFVTDSSPHVSAAVQLAGWRSLPCFANMLNVMAQEALKEVRVRVCIDDGPRSFVEPIRQLAFVHLSYTLHVCLLITYLFTYVRGTFIAFI